MKKNVFCLLGVIFLLVLVFFICFLSTRFRSPGFLRPIFGEDYKAKLIQELLLKNLPLNALPDESADTLATSISGSLIYFSKEKDLSGQVVALQKILEKITIDGGIPKVIDLRFNKPILKY